MITCGIDFGTSNSSIAVAKNGKVALVAVEDSHVTIPSAMFYPTEGERVIGRNAIQAFLSRREGRFMRSLKRVLGTSAMKQGTLVKGKILTFERIIASYIQTLKDRAEIAVQSDISTVVMGRPVHFVDNNVAADQQAQEELLRIAKSIGFTNVTFQYEPIAAALAHEQQLVGEKLALLVDIGGGTSDFTVIKLSDKSRNKADRRDDILANTGVRVGGNDFDKALSLSAVMPAFGYKSTYGEKHLEVPLKYYFDLSEWSKVNFLYVPKVLAQLTQYMHQSHDKNSLARLIEVVQQEIGHLVLTQTEKVKIDLTHQELTDITFPLREPFTLHAKREMFEQGIQHDVTRILGSVEECLRNAAVTADDISFVILTGGSTEVPFIQTQFKTLFPRAEFSLENQLSSVGLGLGYDSVRKMAG